MNEAFREAGYAVAWFLEQFTTLCYLNAFHAAQVSLRDLLLANPLLLNLLFPVGKWVLK